MWSQVINEENCLEKLEIRDEKWEDVWEKGTQHYFHYSVDFTFNVLPHPFFPILSLKSVGKPPITNVLITQMQP